MQAGNGQADEVAGLLRQIRRSDREQMEISWYTVYTGIMREVGIGEQEGGAVR